MLLLAFIISIVINLVMFVPAFIYKTDKLTDASYAISFIVVAALGFAKSTKGALGTLLLVCVCLWALRLGGFLLIRIWNRKRDKRFDGMREHFSKFLRFWVLQGLSVFVILLAVASTWDKPAAGISAMAYVGLVIFAVGLALEAVADLQKYRFGNDPANKGKWIDNGVWRATRHPNYLGEMLVWIGVYYIASTVLTGTTERLIAAASPLYIVNLLLFVSGVPLLEKSADKKWGNQAGYKKYKRNVPVLIPSIRSLYRTFKRAKV